MSLDSRPQTVTAAQYAEAFARERAQDYPAVAAYEARMGFALDRRKMEDAARVLACPIKASAPNWQHGRVIYAAARARLSAVDERVYLLDIGTAKGYSALCAQWALEDSGRSGRVVSVDVIPPDARVRRNTVAEVDALRTLDEILEPYPSARQIAFRESTGIDVLHDTRWGHRIHVAFVDGKHSKDAVAAEWRLLASRQQPGDVAIFDDVQIPAVRDGLVGADRQWRFEHIALDPVNRAYAVGVRL